MAENGQGGGDLLKELHELRKQLSKAERRAALAIETRDACTGKLEAAGDVIAELQRRVEFMNNVQAVLGTELEHKDKLLSQASKSHTEKQNALSAARAEVSTLKIRTADQENEREAESNQAGKLAAALATKEEEIQRLLRQLNSLKASQTTLESKLQVASGIQAELRAKCDNETRQLRAEEEAHSTTKASLQTALRQLGDAQRATHAAQESVAEVATLRREIQLLRKELLQEQGVIAQHEAIIALSAASKRYAENACRKQEEKEKEEVPRAEGNSRVAVMQRRLLAQSKELAEKGTDIEERDEHVKKLHRALDLRKENDTAITNVAHYRSQLLQKERQLRATTAEVTMLRAELERCRAAAGRPDVRCTNH